MMAVGPRRLDNAVRSSHYLNGHAGAIGSCTNEEKPSDHLKVNTGDKIIRQPFTKLTFQISPAAHYDLSVYMVALYRVLRLIDNFSKEYTKRLVISRTLSGNAGKNAIF